VIKDSPEQIVERDKIIVEGTQRIDDLKKSLEEAVKRVAEENSNWS
jgi:hypothetical protein